MKFCFFFSVFLSFVVQVSAEVEILDEQCTCYQTDWSFKPINGVKHFWEKLRSDPILHLNRMTIPYNDLRTFREEYSKRNKEVSEICVQIKHECRTARVINNYYYPSDFQKLLDGLHNLNDINENWELYLRSSIHRHRLCANLVWDECYYSSKEYEKDIAEIKRLAADRRQQWKKYQREIWILYDIVHDHCMKTHVNLRSLYEYGYAQLLFGNYSTSVRTIKKLIDYAKESNNTKYLSADTFLNLGITCSLAHEYSEAIQALNETIKKDPAGVEAYLERAIAYFELGDFETAIEDYLVVNQAFPQNPPSDPFKIKFGTGLARGAAKAAHDKVKDFPANLCNTLRGMGQLLWAAVSSPVEVSEQMVEATIDSIEYIKCHDIRALSKNVAPEFHELVVQWDNLDPEIRGEMAGIIFGRFGFDIFSGYAGTKAMQLAKNLRQANALSNLKALAGSPQNRKSIIAAAEGAMQERQQFFVSAKIQLDKQGKHQRGHKNFDPLQNKSVLTHSNPDELLKKYAGKGHPHAEFKPGKVGYKEVIECDEIIGEVVFEKTGERVLTKRATIHYDKNGLAHIVPAPPSY